MQSLRMPRTAALAGITLLVISAAIASFAESYRGLFDWASRHGLHGVWAAMFPVQVDTFIAVGELALFVALADRWSARSRSGAWLVTLVGLAVSVAANVGHVTGTDVASRLTAAVPPLAASAALAVGLGVLKRVVTASLLPSVTAAAVAPLDTLTTGQRPPMSAIPEPVTGPTPALPAVAAVKQPAKRPKPKASPASVRAAAIVAKEPDISGAELARRLKVSERTGRRYLDMAKANMAAAA